MTQTQTQNRPQHLDALEHGNKIRCARTVHRRRLRTQPSMAAARRLLAELIHRPPPELATMTVYKLIVAAHQHGRTQALAILRTCQVSELRTIGNLTDRERSALVGKLTQLAVSA